MKRTVVAVLAVLMTLILLAGVAGGFFLYKKYAPTKELADQAQWFQVSGDQVAVILNHELVEGVHGRYVDGQVYLPFDWVHGNLNQKFYWDEQEKQMIYTLPESVVYANFSTMGSSGKPLLLEEDGKVWMTAGLVLAYTDVRISGHLEGSVKRVLIDDYWTEVSCAQLKKDEKLRIRGGVKSPILTDVVKHETVEILETLEDWSRVRTDDGYIGYVRNSRLGDPLKRGYASTFDEPVYSNIVAMEEPICLVWHQTMSESANGQMEQLMEGVEGVNVIAPTWLMLTDNQGNYDCLADRSYVDKAHGMGLQVWAVLDNFNRGDNVQSEVLFASTKARKNLIDNLMSDVRTYDLDGLNLDIESIKPEAGPHYVQFVRELSVECRKNGVVLSVDTYVPSAYTSFYNREELGRVVDYMIIMGYDEHYAGGEAGSVASFGYEKKGIEDTLAMVPAEKVISAMPFYTRLWKEGADGEVTSSAMGMEKASLWVEENGMELYWQEELGQYFGQLETEDGRYLLWMEEERSIGEKMKLVRENGLAGSAFWKLGFEPESIWDVIRQQ